MPKQNQIITDGDITIELVDVGPKEAEEGLKHRAKNRKIKEYHARELSQDMKEKNWIFNGIPICYNKKGELIEGQHRLTAIQISKTTQQFIVIRGVEEEAFDTYDLHSKRSTADYLGMENYNYAPTLAAAVRLLTVYKRFGNFTSKEPISHKERMDMLRKYPDLVSFVNAYAKEKLPIRCPTSILSVTHILFKEKDAKAADGYMHGVIYGENLKIGDPAYAARQWIIKRPDTSYTLHRSFTKFAGNVLIHCWNAWRNKEKLSSIKTVQDTPVISR